MASITRGQPLILIVDDDDSFQHALTLELHQAGMKAEPLSEGTRLAEIAAELQPDIVLLDADVGGQDGRDLIAALKRQPKTAHIPIFMTTDKDLRWDRRQAFELGVDDFLDKPLIGLARRVEALLRKLRGTNITIAPRRGDEAIASNSAVDREQAALIRAEEHKRASIGRIPLPSKATERRPVLIIEDDEDVRDSLAHFLESEGIPTLMAGNGREALELLHRESTEPAVILLDLMMPVMDGWEFRRRASEDPSIPRAPMIVMSARPFDGSMGSIPWLRKPLGAEELLSALREATPS